MKKENMAMLCDFYEFTMSNGYFKNGFYKKNVYFDVFFRKVPDNGGFAIMAGLEQAIEYIRELHFEDEDIEYLKSKGIFDEQFLEYLRNFKFSGDVYAIPEGTPIFPNEPVMTIKAPAIEAQLVETFLLLTINHQTLIATKANRIVRAAQAEPYLNLVHAVLRVQMPQLTVQELHISVAARVQPAHLQTSFTVFPPAVQWHIHGFRCSTASMTLLKPTARCIPIILLSLLIHTTH